MLVIRPETEQDHERVYDLVSAAFGKPDEANLVNRIRPFEGVMSLVAVEQDDVLGHILFSPVTLLDEEGNRREIKIAGLAPVAVSPSQQKKGVGSKLILDGLERCKAAGYAGCVLLGHPDYYPRFGFQPARSTFGITSTYSVPDPVFMAKELHSGAFDQLSGTIHYHQQFQGV